MARIQGLVEEYLTGDEALKSEGAVEIFEIDLAFKAPAAAGQQVIFRNGTNGSAPPLLVLTIGAATGTISRSYPNGKRFSNGCYVDFQGAAGALDLSLTWK